MRWSTILVPLRFSQFASSSFANLSKASFSAFPPDVLCGHLNAASSSSQSFAIANSGQAHVAELGNTSSSLSKTAPIRSSAKTIVISEDKDSSVESGCGQGASSQPAGRPTEENFRRSTSETVEREAGRRKALPQVNKKPPEVFCGDVNAASKPSSAQGIVSARHSYEAIASSSNHAKGGFVMSAAKSSRSAPNQTNDEACLSKVNVAGRINHPMDRIASVRTTEVCPSQKESKAKPKLSSHKSLSKNAMHVSTRQVGHATLSAEDVVSAGAEGLSEEITDYTPECALANETFVHLEGSAALEDKNQDELKKPSFAASLPVTVFVEWWFSCFLQADRPFYTTLNHPLNKIYAWLAAYQRVHFDATGRHIHGQRAATLMKQLLNLQTAVLDGKFRWGDEKSVILPMPMGDSTELLSDVNTFSSFQDRVVGEILYLVLEPIFESRFSARSHGFRPGRDAHTALRAAQRSFQGCTWFISGNLSFLHEEIDVTHLIDSVLRVVRDTKVIFLLRSGLSGQGRLEHEESTRTCMFADNGSCSKLMNLLLNVFLDRLDWFMDEQISNLGKRQHSSTQNSSRLLLKPETMRAERPYKLEYLRYGTEILVACNGTAEAAEAVEKNIKSFFKQKFNMDLGDSLTINHIAGGVQFLDHVISQKIVCLSVSCRRASNGRVFEKQAQRIRLSIKASRECCLMYLKQIKTPTRSQHIEQMLVVLDKWYHCAENKEKIMQYCKWTLCYLYAKGVVETKGEGLMVLAEQFKEAMRTVGCDQRKPGVSDKANLMQDFYWSPEHENVLRELKWLHCTSSMTEAAASFKAVRKVSHQQHMSQVAWQYLVGACRSNVDNSWESEVQMQTSSWGQESMVHTKLEDIAESAG